MAGWPRRAPSAGLSICMSSIFRDPLRSSFLAPSLLSSSNPVEDANYHSTLAIDRVEVGLSWSFASIAGGIVQVSSLICAQSKRSIHDESG